MAKNAKNEPKTENLEDLIADQSAELASEGEETDAEVSDEALDELAEGFPTLAEVDADDLEADDDDCEDEDCGSEGLESDEDLDDDVSLRPKRNKGNEWARVGAWESVFGSN